jgi:hypothetical protein
MPEIGQRQSCLGRPRRQWSLWDIMINFFLQDFDLTVRELHRLQRLTEEQSKLPAPALGSGLLAAALSGIPSAASDKHIAEVREVLKQIEGLAKEIELDSTLKRLWRPQMKVDYSPTYAALHTELTVLDEAIQDDLRGKWFYYYKRDRLQLVREIKNQWGSAYEKFKPIQREIYYAVDCYAIEHPTACVFHLMRIMEFGVQRFGRRLGVSLTRQSSQKIHDLSWNDILDAMNPVIKAMPVNTPARKARHEKIRAVQSYLYAVKDAWRNPTMHPRKKGYKDAEALDILNQVRAFMVGLAGSSR